MLRILFVTERWFPQGGGGEIDYHSLASFIVKAGHEVFVLTGESPILSKEIPHKFKSLRRLPANYVPDEDFRFSNLLKRIIFTFKLLRNVVLIVRKHNIDLIHTSTPILSTVLFITAFFLKRPLIATNLSYFLNSWQKITNNYLKAKIFEIIELISYRLPYSFLISVSPKFIELVRTYGVKTSIVHIPNAVDFETFNPNVNSKNILNRYSLSGNMFLISFIGRLVPQKGVDVLIKAIPQVNSFFENCTYLIVGDGSHRRNLEDLVKKLNIKNVIFTGAVHHSRIPEFISASEIIVLPSLGAEGSPRILLEAMACKKPIIATNVGGIKDLVIDGKTGLLVEEGNAQKIAKVIISLLKNKELREEMGINAYEFIKDKFTWERVGNETLKIYKKAIASYKDNF